MEQKDALVAKLQQANWAYHNAQPIMTDDEYDRGIEQLRILSPSHPFLAVIGAPSTKGIVLPCVMGSQDKARTDEEMRRWASRQISKSLVVSDKLDGLSALYTGKQLYLRGDGVKGVDVSFALKRIVMPGPGSARVSAAGWMVRGELLLRKADIPEGSIGRSIVNGWLHKDSVNIASTIRFVAYQVLGSKMTRSEQMKWLASAGFEVPWWLPLGLADLSTTLMKRRSESIYPIDGLVVGTDTVPLSIGGGEARNPTDSIAFKLSLDDQKAETTVIQIEWNASRHGMLIPRIQIEPVEIGGATIQWLSGHNAALIFEKKLGPGARIIIRRSGDVIPALDSVLMAAPAGAQMPACHWEWDSTKVQAVTNTTTGSKALLHALQTLEVEGIGPGLVAKLVEGGIDTMRKLWNAKTLNIGAGRGPALMTSLRKKREEASLVTLLIASNLLPRGVGERKMRVLFDKEADPRKWTSSMKVAGWSTETLEELVSALPAALEWTVSSFPGFAHAHASAPAPAPAPAPVALAGHVVFTGVRDKMLEEAIKGKWSIDDSITKKTTVLVTADEAKETGKVKKAREAGLRIMTITEFRGLC